MVDQVTLNTITQIAIWMPFQHRPEKTTTKGTKLTLFIGQQKSNGNSSIQIIWLSLLRFLLST